MNPAETLEHIRALNRARAIRYYEKKRPEIAARRKEEREKINDLKAAAKEAAAERRHGPRAAVVPAAPPKGGRLRIVVDGRSVPLLNEEQSIEGIENLNTTEGNMKTNKDFIKNVFTLLRNAKLEAKLNPLLKNAEDFEKFLDSAKQIKNPKKEYVATSKRNFVNAVINVLKGYGYTKTNEDFDVDGLWAVYKRYKTTHLIANEKQKINQKEPTFDYNDYLGAVLKHFKKNSEEYLFSVMFDEVTVRGNNYTKMPVIDDEDLATKAKTNYLVVPDDKTDSCSVILNDYKTVGKHGVAHWAYSDDTSALIRAYLKAHKNPQRIFLETSTKLLDRIGKKLNEKITMNTLRHSVASTLFAAKPTAAELNRLCEIMGNTPDTLRDSYLFPLRPLNKK